MLFFVRSASCSSILGIAFLRDITPDSDSVSFDSLFPLHVGAMSWVRKARTISSIFVIVSEDLEEVNKYTRHSLVDREQTYRSRWYQSQRSRRLRLEAYTLVGFVIRNSSRILQSQPWTESEIVHHQYYLGYPCSRRSSVMFIVWGNMNTYTWRGLRGDPWVESLISHGLWQSNLKPKHDKIQKFDIWEDDTARRRL